MSKSLSDTLYSPYSSFPSPQWPIPQPSELHRSPHLQGCHLHQVPAVWQQRDNLCGRTGAEGTRWIGDLVSESSQYPVPQLYWHLLSHSLPCRTLNNNNLTALPRDLFAGMRLRALRLSDNPFACDCHLSWLSRYLRSASRLAPNTKCHSPSQLKGQNVADLHDQDFKCSGKWISVQWSRPEREKKRCVIAIPCSVYGCYGQGRDGVADCTPFSRTEIISDAMQCYLLPRRVVDGS